MKKVLLDATWNDEFYTPAYAIEPLLKYLDKSLIYWECTDFGESQITKVLKDNGFNIISTNIKDFDFFFHVPDFYYDVIITNPPYSLKDEFIERCYFLKKPFALLLPITTLEGIKRGSMFRRWGIELLVFDKRINFMAEKKSNWFNTSWFCHQILPEKLMFEKIKGV